MPPSASASAAPTIEASKNCTSSMPDDVVARRPRHELRHALDGDRAHARTRVRDDVGCVVAVVDPRLEDDHSLPGDLRAAQAPDHLLALAGEHRPADDFEPAAVLWWDPDHGREATGRIGRIGLSLRGGEGGCAGPRRCQDSARAHRRRRTGTVAYQRRARSRRGFACGGLVTLDPGRGARAARARRLRDRPDRRAADTGRRRRGPVGARHARGAGGHRSQRGAVVARRARQAAHRPAAAQGPASASAHAA